MLRALQNGLRVAFKDPINIILFAVPLLSLVIVNSSRKRKKRLSNPTLTPEQQSLCKALKDAEYRYRDSKKRKTPKEKIIARTTTTTTFSHQVAGHTDEELRIFEGRVIKPCRRAPEKQVLFLREVAVYETFYSKGKHATFNALPFIAPYFGVLYIDAATGREAPTSATDASASFPQSSPPSSISSPAISSSTPRSIVSSASNNNKANPPSTGLSFFPPTVNPYIVLDDLTASFKHPCAIDIKIGTQTYEPSASPEKVTREKLKYRYQAEVGFRIAGFKAYDVLSQSYRYVDKKFGRSLAPDKVAQALSLFFYNGMSYRREVLHSVIQNLENILLWMRSQTLFHFYCSSILIIYDGEVAINGERREKEVEVGSKGKEDSASATSTNQNVPLDDIPHFLDRHYRIETPESLDRIKKICQSNVLSLQCTNSQVKVCMIDFAHSIPAPGTIDKGYIHGLESLIKRFHDVLDISNHTDIGEDIVKKLALGYLLPKFT